MEPRGRGRARGGRARGDATSATTQPASRPGQPHQQRGQGPPSQQQRGPAPSSQAPVPQGAWGRQPHAATQAQPTAWAQKPPQQQQTQHMVGRGSRQGGGEDLTPEQIEPVRHLSGAGDAVQTQAVHDRGGGNGGVRGRQNRNEVIHTRPAQLQTKQGSTGQPIQLSANFFKLIQHGTWCLFQYRVDFSPEIDDTRQRQRLMRTALKSVVNGFLFDGTVLYSPQRLSPDPMELFAQTETEETIRIQIRMVGELAWGDHHYLQVFNIIVRKCLSLLKLQLIRRDYYDPNARISIPEYKMELWPGYFTSIRQHEKDILMNSEITVKMMRTDNVYDELLTCSKDRNSRTAFQTKVIGRVVLTYYNNKTYRIDDVDFDASPNSTFPKADGSTMSYVQYYRQKYNINIQVDSQPMLISRSKPREIRAGMAETVYLVPELCQLTGLTDEQRNNFQLMSALAQHTRVGPQKRIQKLLDFAKRLTGNPEVIEKVRCWDLDLANTLVQFQGRVLPTEAIFAGANNKYSAGPKADWTRDLRGNQMIVAGIMERLAVITPAKFSRQTQEFMKVLQTAASGMRWSVANHKIFEIRDDRSATYLDQIQDVIAKANPTMILAVLQSKSADRYSAIKKKCCVDRGIPTQVVVAKNLTHKGVMSIATKIAIQMNCKIGGAPWSVAMPLKNLMVVGYDVCRDTANRGKSFGGMVASLNQAMTRFYSGASEHQYEEELSDNFGSFLVLACQKYKEINGVYPEKILIYRDGVGDGQLPYVVNHEIENIKKKLEQEIYSSNNLKMAFIVVSKRINTRIFYKDDNPPPGTVVDDVITLPERYDFFIVSQCTQQGTVAPTSYNVIYDTMGLPADRMQILTYKLTHMYYNWSGTVRVPAPCQYAHKLSFLVAQSLHRPAHRNLETLLYYL